MTLASLPMVGNNIDALASLLCDKRIWGLPKKHCVRVRDPRTAAEMLDPVTDAAAQATDTLLLYYSGHGLIDSRRGDLHLSLVDSDPARIYTAVPYGHLRDAMLDSRAIRRIAVLDSCFSGRALGVMADPVSVVVDEASAEGTYIITSAAENKVALAPEGEQYTAFTGELLEVLRGGIPGHGEWLDLDSIFNQIRAAMRAKSRPVPQKRDRNTAGQLSLVRNQAYSVRKMAVDPRLLSAVDDRRESRPKSEGAGRAPGWNTRLMGGRYELEGLVGLGGFTEVFRARDIRLARIVAVKTLRGDLARDATFQARFRRDLQSTASVNYPSIVAVYDTGEDVMTDTLVPYVVMEFVDGRTLRDLLRGDRRLLPERAAEITEGVLGALDYSHRNGIVHGDIKPGSVMLTRDGDVKVKDLGVGRAVSGSQMTMTQTAREIVTTQYLSPERARGERLDARSDLYSTGCLLYEMLTARPPFTGDSPVAIAYQHLREDAVPPSQVDPDVPGWSDAIVLKAMKKDPADRYQSAGEMRNDLRRALAGAPVPTSSPVPPSRQPNRKPWQRRG